MGQYMSLIEDSDKETTIKQALNFADNGPHVVHKKVFRFMFFLSDNPEFDKEELIQMAVEFYGLLRDRVEGIYKNVEHAGDI